VFIANLYVVALVVVGLSKKLIEAGTAWLRLLLSVLVVARGLVLAASPMQIAVAPLNNCMFATPLEVAEPITLAVISILLVVADGVIVTDRPVMSE
jgi:hypothetical protein